MFRNDCGRRLGLVWQAADHSRAERVFLANGASFTYVPEAPPRSARDPVHGPLRLDTSLAARSKRSLRSYPARRCVALRGDGRRVEVESARRTEFGGRRRGLACDFHCGALASVETEATCAGSLTVRRRRACWPHSARFHHSQPPNAPLRKVTEIGARSVWHLISANGVWHLFS
jgi:hypothetical protein